MNSSFDTDLERALNSIVYGEELVKFGGWGNPHIRKFFIDPLTMDKLQWITPAKVLSKSSIDLKTITKITFGLKTLNLKKHKVMLKGKEDLTASIFYKLNDKDELTLNVLFKNPLQMKLFITGLQYIILKETRGLILSQIDNPENNHLNDMWSKHQEQDADADLIAIGNIIKDLNIRVYPCYFDKLLKPLLVDEKINYANYLSFVEQLTKHEELKEIFCNYSNEKNLESNISILSLRDFFVETQKESITLAECRSMIQVARSFTYTEYDDLISYGDEEEEESRLYALSNSKYKKIRKESELKVFQKLISSERAQDLSFMGFSNIILSRTNDMIDINCPFVSNMNFPLPYYIINTSYYTCMKVNCETGELEVNAANYKKHLLKGVRCITIDLIVFEFMIIGGRK